MMKRWHAVKRLLPLFAGLVLLLSACGRADLSTLNPQGPVADKQYGLMLLAITIMTIVVVAVFAIAIYVVIRYRRRPGQDEIPKQIEGNHKLEVIWTVIPILLLIILAVPTVKYVFAFAEDYSGDPDAVNVKVTGHQFWWEFEYTDLGINTAHDLVIPKGKKIAIELRTADVLHSFWIPAIAGKMDTNPQGNVNKMFIEAYEEGLYRGKCAELCGQSHALMEFKVKSVSDETFKAWVAEMKAEPKAFEGDPKVAESFKQNCLTCHAIDNAPALGPNLKGFGSREAVAGIMLNRETVDEPIEQAVVEEQLRQWITEPQKVKPGNTMPAFKDQLSEEELDGIVKYLAEYKLESLKEFNKQ
ncbi:cytochrome c oxidase subunit II [Paenibacillus apiarius]|uniref:Cytochrome c oxidase subunit 2 n=1 Tax=Paenibacillus apiarius TaxID=46240 RepID=A0ABT4DPQ9_9BACL|nr:cytochrome c oxidase subunit II [Paenibacillus apiarius]MCY9515593.1 cytochrome c oxidase subunit II [Paenibacillus apiarius]MCY9519334.1 cytochrome c oxidase subunit II [Paenibacillus apiarius]MCY9550970.1 cytochrome c oxidase subunit II [Paenibacillus apiarius]MCY9558938.1 cytochrome c oxidase subunit II [Paenibacillus apiarius]MCY9683585.1 cytochrome c oxidase subunit II [Paenibacillus apiarius]